MRSQFGGLGTAAAGPERRHGDGGSGPRGLVGRLTGTRSVGVPLETLKLRPEELVSSPVLLFLPLLAFQLVLLLQLRVDEGALRLLQQRLQKGDGRAQSYYLFFKLLVFLLQLQTFLRVVLMPQCDAGRVLLGDSQLLLEIVSRLLPFAILLLREILEEESHGRLFAFLLLHFLLEGVDLRAQVADLCAGGVLELLYHCPPMGEFFTQLPILVLQLLQTEGLHPQGLAGHSQLFLLLQQDERGGVGGRRAGTRVAGGGRGGRRFGEAQGELLNFPISTLDLLPEELQLLLHDLPAPLKQVIPASQSLHLQRQLVLAPARPIPARGVLADCRPHHAQLHNDYEYINCQDYSGKE